MFTDYGPVVFPEDADALIVIDPQRGFIDEGTRHLPARLAEMVRQAEAREVPVIVTRFINDHDSLFRSHVGWHESGAGAPDSRIIPELDRYWRHALIKHGYGSRGVLPNRCDNLKVSRPLVVGIDTDSCVLACALELFDRGIWPRISASCCGSTGGPEYHESALAILGRTLGAAAILP